MALVCSWLIASSLIPAAMFVMVEMAAARRPRNRARMTSGTVDMPTTSAYDVRVITTTTGDLPADDPLDERDQSDPDLFIFRDGRVVDFGNSGEANQEIFTTAVLSGPDTYVADLQEFRYADPESPVGFPDRMCFDVSFTPVP